MAVLLATSDLLFSSRVSAAAGKLGKRVTIVHSRQQLDEAVAQSSPELVIVDLSQSWLDLPALLAALPAVTQVIAYGPHVAAEALQAARQAGCRLVLTKGQFAQRLPDLLHQYLSADSLE